METKITVCWQWVYRVAEGLSMQSATDTFMLYFMSYLVWFILALVKNEEEKSMTCGEQTTYMHEPPNIIFYLKQHLCIYACGELQ